MATELFVTPSRCVYCAADRLVGTRASDHIDIGMLTEGKPLKCRLTNPRNPKVHRLYFSAIAAAAKHWPEGAEPEPGGDADLLRAWLQVKAGYAIKRVFSVEAMPVLIALIGDVRASDKYAFVKQTTVAGEPAAVAFIPLSISYAELDDEAFAPIKSSVFDIIESTLGCTITQLVEADEKET